MNKEQEENIKGLTGFSLVEIINFTEGEFVRNIWKLYYKHVLSEKQYLWLQAIRKKKITPEVQDVLDIIGGELI